MRTALLIISSVALLAACADKDPTSPNATAPSLAQDYPPGPNLKPVDQVGWTKAATYTSNDVSLAPGISGPAAVQCPAGTTVTGGGFEFAGGLPAALVVPPVVWYSGPNPNGTGWIVFAKNFAGSGATVTIRSNVRCAS